MGLSSVRIPVTVRDGGGGALRDTPQCSPHPVVSTGAGIFVTTVVAGGIALVKPFTAASRPFLRDAIFYMVAVFLTFLILYLGRITLGEALGE